MMNFKSAIAYLRKRNQTAVERTERAIQLKVRSPLAFPFIGALYEEDASGIVRETQSGNYRIFYEVQESDATITILAIRHARQADPDFAE